jgi:hypothetical protein
MGGTVLLVAAANGLFALACGTVGVRLLLLARRSHQLPELYLGLGFCCMVAAVGVLGASGLGRETVGEVDLLLLAVGLALLWFSITAQAAFTWKTFRSSCGWAEILVLSIGAAEALVVGGVLHSLGSAERSVSNFEAAHSWLALLRLPLGASYLWTCVEALLEYGMARRRQHLGLGDPVVTNRLLLWALTSSTGVFSIFLGTTLHLAGKGPFADPVAAGCMAMGGFVAASLLWLAFIPPARYERWISARAARARTAAA